MFHLAGDDQEAYFRVEREDGNWSEEFPRSYDGYGVSSDAVIASSPSGSTFVIQRSNSSYGFFPTYYVPYLEVLERTSQGSWRSSRHQVPVSLLEQYLESPYSSRIEYGTVSASGDVQGRLHAVMELSDVGLVYFTKAGNQVSWQFIENESYTNPRLTTESSYRRYSGLDLSPDGKLFLCVLDYNGLRMLTNRNGGWESEMVVPISYDISDEEVCSSDIAFDPVSDQPRIVTSYAQRVSTGSLIRMSLRYHTRSSSGTWTYQTIANTSSGYNGTDGQKGTGFCPDLAFDDSGNPHVVFTDYASSHFSHPEFGSVADEFNGSLRYGTRANGTWSFRDLVTQTEPITNQLTHPCLQIRPGEITWSGTLMKEDPDEPTVYLHNGAVSGRFSLQGDDADADGLSDSWELTNFGSLDIADRFSNTDGDSRSDFEEQLAGTDPNEPDGTLPLYNQWATVAGLMGDDALPEAAPFGDGVANLLKYAFNLNGSMPDNHSMTSGGTSGLPGGELVEDGGQTYWRVEFVRRKNAGIIYTPQKSTTLVENDFIPLVGTPVVSDIDTDWERVVIQEPCDPATTSKCFSRLLVELP